MQKISASYLIILVVTAIIIVAAVFSSFYVVSSNNQLAQVPGYKSSISSLNSEVSSLQSFASSLSAHPSTTTVITNVTMTTTTPSYPTDSNVTVFFTQVVGQYQFEINATNFVNDGASNSSLSIPIKPSFAGEPVLISAKLPTACSTDSVTVILYVNGTVVAQSSTLCGNPPVIIEYTL